MRSLILLALAAATTARSLLSPRQTTTPLPSTFHWTSSDILVTPKNDTRHISGLKDPSIIFHNGAYHVFASIAKATGDNYNLVYFNFTDFAAAHAAPFAYLDQSALGPGYRAAPEVFFFAPQQLWYLVYQNGNAAYSTNRDISDPAGWSAPATFYSGTPALIEAGVGTTGYWVDMWVICDAAHCHLFSSDDNGRLYRSQTALADFPRGMSEPVVALQDTKENLFEAANVYALGNGNGSASYLLLVECIGAGDSPGGVRYFRSWTAASLDGKWTALAATQENPFMGAANVRFESGRSWTTSISHGEIVRSDVDQNLRIGPVGSWRFMYQGVDPKSTDVTYNDIPWNLGLLTQVAGK
ncbi:alpha-L-arab-like proteininofuranosidase precursor [Massariosphaeria phaeospora]|uniref:Alpha-L-arabinofuranosidase n=1 Tax=Massariosphaeria phaeospora TaxID=100035 RepID=A0A7C8ICZ4_9PLEO|nr:alpha-L-arab-like proteininofuranosidase precursor [Massariosphaeria phaeospora]